MAAVLFCTINLWKWHLINGKVQRDEIPEVPVDALREAVVNAFATGLSRSTVARIIKRLKESGKIERKGSRKKGYWEVCE